MFIKWGKVVSAGNSRPVDMNKGGGMARESGGAGSRGQWRKNWDNYNSIINFLKGQKSASLDPSYIQD